MTSITVAHRFATVIDCDEIILLVNGEVHERGTHKQLLEKNGEYARIYNLQTQRRHAEEVMRETEKSLTKNPPLRRVVLVSSN